VFRIEISFYRKRKYSLSEVLLRISTLNFCSLNSNVSYILQRASHTFVRKDGNFYLMVAFSNWRCYSYIIGIIHSFINFWWAFRLIMSRKPWIHCITNLNFRKKTSIIIRLNQSEAIFHFIYVFVPDFNVD